MSKCPDALACEAVFDRVLQIVGHDKVDLSLEFISTPSDLEDAGAACKHGPSECHGNIQQLCTIAHTPAAPTSSQWWWPFLTCLDAAGKDNIGSDELARDCAEVTAIDWVGSGIEECVNGEEGKELLRKSGERVRSLGIEKSCTMIINDRVRCIKDGEWQPCEGGHEPADFVRTINEEYARLNPGIAH
ncbi:hypothetical protein DL93DRAFT_2087894 [Clavulina sp. PMI_390]|nr:hypothetical protein DL93DRAFT_2087894 [Clavulina sp. PMI_390]